tara:strand:+ start:3037 stop:3339 length:303 start_codon:yes stop_codon:yes gene_type:complete
MRTAPDAVYVIIPCMKELGMSWSEIKDTPRYELVGLLAAMSNYNQLHQFDGYTAEEIGKMGKEKPGLLSDYANAMDLKAGYEIRSGKERKVLTFKEAGIN